MAETNSVAKLIYINSEQKQQLLEIEEEVSKIGGKTSSNQLIRDAIDVLVYFYKDKIIEQYKPKSIKELIK